MANINNWLSYGDEYENFVDDLAPVRAILAWRRITAKPVSVRFRTSAGILSAQTVRIESYSSANSAASAAGVSPKREVIIYGVRDHPSVPDTIMDEGYTFNHAGDTYVVRDVILTLGEVQGISEATR